MNAMRGMLLVVLSVLAAGLVGVSTCRGDAPEPQAAESTPPVQEAPAATEPAPAADAAEKKPEDAQEGAAQESETAVPEGMEVVKISLPKPLYSGTPRNIPPRPTLEKYQDKRKPFIAPKGTVNVALKKPVTASDSEPIIGSNDLVTDGNKEGDEDSFVEYGPGLQWVQIDLEKPCTIYAIVLWHYHREARVYHDVVVQVADDPDFIENVRTVFNNDFDNSSGLGVGKDLEWIEGPIGKLIEVQGVKGRYIRLYSRGNTSNGQSHYVEVEVYGKPAP